jgi:hypothetical protein
VHFNDHHELFLINYFLQFFKYSLFLVLKTVHRDQLPTFFQLIQLRMERHGPGDVNKFYLYFCQHFLPLVVGKKKFDKGMKHGMKLTDIATVSDEAFALLLVDNSEARWLKCFETSLGAVGKLPATKYTFKGQSRIRTGCTVKFHGWNDDGLKQFNALSAMVKQDRRLNGSAFDSAFSDYWSKLQHKTLPQKINFGPPIEAYSDLFDDDNEDGGDDVNIASVGISTASGVSETEEFVESSFQPLETMEL